MSYAIHQGVRIHYRVEGAGPPLVLQHGFFWSVEGWYRVGYVDALRRNYRLILIDARGHGASDKPHDDAAYSLPQHVGDIVAVLDALDLATAHFWGYSMGGRFGFGMAKYAAARVTSLIIGGVHPYRRRVPVAGLPDDADPEALLDAFFQIMGLDREAFSPAEEAEFLDNDFHALAACRQGRSSLGGDIPPDDDDAVLAVRWRGRRQFVSSPRVCRAHASGKIRIYPGRQSSRGILPR